MLGHQQGRGALQKGRPAREHTVDDHAQGVDVSLDADLLPVSGCLLGRDVHGRPHHHARHGEGLAVIGVSVHHLGDAEVEDLQQHGLAVHHEDVLRFEIPVDDPAIVGGLQAGADLHQVGEHLPGRELALLGDDLAQLEPVEVSHDIEQPAIFQPAVVIHLDDVGVLDVRERLGFVVEALRDARVVGEMVSQHLDGHLPPDLRMLGPVHRAHAPFAQQAGDHVVADLFFQQRIAGGAHGWPIETSVQGKHMEPGGTNSRKKSVFVSYHTRAAKNCSRRALYQEIEIWPGTNAVR